MEEVLGSIPWVKSKSTKHEVHAVFTPYTSNKCITVEEHVDKALNHGQSLTISGTVIN